MIRMGVVRATTFATASAALLLGMIDGRGVGLAAQNVTGSETHNTEAATVDAADTDLADQLSLLRETLESAVPRLIELEPLAEAEVADRARRRAAELGVRTDTFQVGPLTVVSLDHQRAVVEATVTRASAPFATWLVGAEWVVSEQMWGVQLYDDRETELGIWTPGVRMASSPRVGGSTLLAERVANEIGQLLAARLPPVLADWAGSAPLVAPGRGATYTMEDLYRAGVTSGSEAVSECLAGAVDSCWSVLGFPRSDAPALEWYSAEELRARAVRTAGLQRPRGLAEPTAREIELLEAIDDRLERCLDGDGASCVWLDSNNAHAFPLPMVARTSLLRHALELGGEGAFARLLESESTDVQELIGTAARRDPDAVVRGWAARVADAQPVVHEDLGVASALSLVWVLVFGGVAVAGAARRVS